MGQALADYISAHGLGELREEVLLGGAFPASAPAQTGLMPQLCRSDQLVLVGVGKGGPVAHQVLSPERLRYRESLLGDTLLVDEQALEIPRGRGARVLELLARAHIGEPTEGIAAIPGSRFVESLGPVERAWIRRWVGPEEGVLAWLHCDETLELDSWLLTPQRVPLRYLLTTARHALVGVSRAGDVHCELLLAAPLVLHPKAGRDQISVGGRSWRSSLRNDSLFAELSELGGRSAAERTRKLAASVWRDGAKSQGEQIRRVEALLQPAAGEALADLSLCFLAWREGDEIELGSSFDAFWALSNAGEELLGWWKEWGSPLAFGRALVTTLCAVGERETTVALPLHRQLRETLRGQREPGQGIDDELLWCEHLVRVDEPAQARTALEALLVALPTPSVFELVVDVNDIETPGEGPSGAARRQRIRALELLLEASAGGEQADVATDLARMQPLFPTRLERLHELVETEHRRGRVEAARRFLTRPAVGDDGREPAPPVKLSSELLEERLRHPQARSDGLLSSLQTFLAKASAPDCSALKAYCERAQYRHYPDLEDAVNRGLRILGIPRIEVFISRGEKSVGLRAYDAKVPFLLIGGEHLDPQTPAFLSPGALRFAIGMELGHLRFGHSRITPQEVWAGGLELGVQGIGVLAAATPFLRAITGGRLGRLVGHFGGTLVEKVVKKITPDGTEHEGLSLDTSELIAAHRVMQFTADRAGLVAAGSLEAALEAIVGTHPARLGQRALLAKQGVAEFLVSHSPHDPPSFDLALRVAALVSFFISDDFEILLASEGP